MHNVRSSYPIHLCCISHASSHYSVSALTSGYSLPIFSHQKPFHSQTFENKSSFETNVFVVPFPVTPLLPVPAACAGALLHPPKSSSFVISGLTAFPVPIPSVPPPTPVEELAPPQPKSPSPPTAGFDEEDGAGGEAKAGCVVVVVVSLDSA